MAPTTRQASISKNSTSSMNKTKKSQPNEDKFGRKCRDCNGTYENNFLFARHSLMVHQRQVKCPMHECSRKLKSVSGLMNHFRTTHKNACSLCGHSNKNKQGLLIHLALVHDLKRCVCSVSRRDRMKNYFE